MTVEHASAELPAGEIRRWRTAVGILSGAVILLVCVLVWVLVSRGAAAGVQLASRGGAAVAGIQPIFSVSGPGKGPRPKFDRPLAAAFAPNGDIYVVDTGNNRICVFDSNGVFKFEFGGLGVAKPLPSGRYTWQPGLMNYPSGIAIDSAGNVFVADLRNNQIQEYDSRGLYIRRFPDPSSTVGKGGSGYSGRGIAVTDLAVDNGRVFATDTYQIFEFTTNGDLITQWGKPGPGLGDLDHPTGVAISGNTLAVSDSDHVRVVGFSTDGAPLWQSDNATSAPNSARIELPRGIAKYGPGWIVADAFGHDLIQLDSKGAVVAYYGTRGVGPGEFNFPTDVDVRGSRLVIADKENNRVQVVRLSRGGQ